MYWKRKEKTDEKLDSKMSPRSLMMLSEFQLWLQAAQEYNLYLSELIFLNKSLYENDYFVF